MAIISLDSEAAEQLNGKCKTLLDTIDSLREHGVSRFIDLPQIIVVGDQSSGKSSVLEAISRVPFPIKDGLCTRFATELVLRTDSRTRIDVRVVSASASADEPRTFNESGFDKEQLPRIVEEAKAHMIRGNSVFSEDVLRVEICSPDVPHLTLIDLPGFYHAEDSGQSTDDHEIVGRLVEAYMARKYSIILAVVSAQNQVAMQKVLSKVKEHDIHQERTLGIVTKPDLLIPGSRDEDSFIRLVRNQDPSHRLTLGWHVLRNRSETEASLAPEERDTKEQAFFDLGIWAAIPTVSRGVGTLRKRLADILLNHIRKNLDALIRDVQENINHRKRTLERLGAPRTSPPQLRAYLSKIASRYQLLSLHAIEGNYSDEFFGGLYPADVLASADINRLRKLRALVRDLNRTFAYVLATKGSRRLIVSDRAKGLDDDEAKRKHEIGLPSFLRKFETQYPFDKPEQVTRDSVKVELEHLSASNQGTEFPGTTKDLMAVKLFRDQSQPWEAIARFHIDLLLRITKSFTESLVAHITGSDQKTCSAILSNIVDPFFETRTVKLESKLQELLYHFRHGYPQPSNVEFRVILEERQQNRLSLETLQSLISARPELFTDKGIRHLSGFCASGKKSEFGVDNIIDKSEAYYELSLRTFQDNIIILAIENQLIKELPGILTTNAVSLMNDNMLETMAAESADIFLERGQLEAECEVLQNGLDTYKAYRSRNSIVLPEILLESRDSSLANIAGLDAERPPVRASSTRDKTTTSRNAPSINTSNNANDPNQKPSSVNTVPSITTTKAPPLPKSAPLSSRDDNSSKTVDSPNINPSGTIPKTAAIFGTAPDMTTNQGLEFDSGSGGNTAASPVDFLIPNWASRLESLAKKTATQNPKPRLSSSGNVSETSSSVSREPRSSTRHESGRKKGPNAQKRSVV